MSVINIPEGHLLIKMIPATSDVIILEDKHFKKDDIYIKKIAKKGIVEIDPSNEFKPGEVIFIDPRGGLTFFHDGMKLTFIKVDDILGKEVE